VLAEPDGPSSLALCPGTTYQGTFTIARNVALWGLTSVLDGGGSGPVVTVEPGVVAEVRALTITNGSSERGGGISNAGTLEVAVCTVTSNQATGNAGVGGGLYNTGTLRLTGGRVSGNQASQDGGAIYNAGSVTLGGATIQEENRATRGGGIFNAPGAVTVLSHSQVFASHAGTDGGGIYNDGGTVTLERSSSVGGNQAMRFGGGIFTVGGASTLTLGTQCTVGGNDADPANPESGGGIYNSPSDPGTVQFVDTSRVAGNQPNNCTGVMCPS
jgi:predicted outer membrane repeat protein